MTAGQEGPGNATSGSGGLRLLAGWEGCLAANAVRGLVGQ
jgi:hypothetical protein